MNQALRGIAVRRPNEIEEISAAVLLVMDRCAAGHVPGVATVEDNPDESALVPDSPHDRTDFVIGLAVQLTIKLIDPATASKVLSEAVREKIKWLSEEFSKKKKWKNDYLVIVLGSTGTRTMTFASDVDLIFAVKNSGKHEKIQKEFQELLGNLKKELSPFSVDCRLRPEGASSQLVWDFDKYIEYLNNRARIWEFQSFLKASPVSGNENLFGKLAASFQQRISKLTLKEIITGITKIRPKSLSSFPAEMNLVDLKKNPGGLSDVEYVVHYLLLSTPESAFQFIGSRIPVILNELSPKSEHKKVLNELADNYIFISATEDDRDLLRVVVAREALARAVAAQLRDAVARGQHQVGSDQGGGAGARQRLLLVEGHQQDDGVVSGARGGAADDGLAG